MYLREEKILTGKETGARIRLTESRISQLRTVALANLYNVLTHRGFNPRKNCYLCYY